VSTTQIDLFGDGIGHRVSAGMASAEQLVELKALVAGWLGGQFCMRRECSLREEREYIHAILGAVPSALWIVPLSPQLRKLKPLAIIAYPSAECPRCI